MIKPNLPSEWVSLCRERVASHPPVLPRGLRALPVAAASPASTPAAPSRAALPQIGRSGPCPAPPPPLRLTACPLALGRSPQGWPLGLCARREQSLQTPAVAALPGPWVRPMGCLLPVTQLLKPLPLAPARKTRPP